MRRRLAIAAAAAVPLLLSLDAAPQRAGCGKAGAIADRLARRHGEIPVWRGQRGSTTVYVLYLSKNGATWSFVTEFANGNACLSATGLGWNILSLPPGGKRI